MDILTAIFDARVTLGILVLALLAVYLGYHLILGVRVYFRFRGTRLVICPETGKPAVVSLAAASMGLQTILDEPCLRLTEWSRWPMREDCGEDCLKQIESRSPELRFSGACRVS